LIEAFLLNVCNSSTDNLDLLKEDYFKELNLVLLSLLNFDEDIYVKFSSEIISSSLIIDEVLILELDDS